MKKIIELCKMPDQKIVNGRIGKDKYGEYTCQTKKGQSTIYYAIMSIELFHKTNDFYIDTLDTCMSDVHCPVCIVFSCKKGCSDNLNTMISIMLFVITANALLKTM